MHSTSLLNLPYRSSDSGWKENDSLGVKASGKLLKPYELDQGEISCGRLSPKLVGSSVLVIGFRREKLVYADMFTGV